MNCIRIILIIFLLEGCNVYAQQKQGGVFCPLYRDVSNMTVVDTGYIRIWYALNADSLNNLKTYIDLQCLEIGSRISKYYSHWVFTSDSLRTIWTQQNPQAESGPRRLGEGGKKPYFWSEYQYSDYFKEANALTEYARMPFAMKKHDCFYTEPYPLQEWEILPDTLTVKGFLCQKATCRFRGRDFEAWFAADIPISDGPWKFGGLPGLILKVYDTRLLYTFECVKIENQKFFIKKHNYSNYHDVERKRLLKLQYAINENFMKTGGAISRTGKPFLSTPYEPLELY